MKEQSRQIFKRTGYRYIYARLLKNGAFNGLGKTPYESVRIAPCLDALEVLSMENAMS